MSDDVQQTNWVLPIIIAIVLAAPGWYLYYDISEKTKSEEKRNLFKVQRLEKQLEIVRDNAASDYANWRRRFQDANQALIAANAKLRSIRLELKKADSESVAVNKASDLNADQTDLLNQLKNSDQLNKELTVKLEKQNSKVESLSNELEQINSKYSIALEELKTIKTANQQQALIQSQTVQNKKIAEEETSSKVAQKHPLINNQLREEHAQLKQEFKRLQKTLSEAVKKKEMEILTFADNSTVIRLQSNVLFDSASALLKDEAKPALDKIAMALQDMSYQKVSIEGHTDALQIIGVAEGQSQFISNWELSAARAAAAARYLLYTNEALDATKVQIVGHGAYSPVADNATPEGRQLNRRIEIRIISDNQGEKAR